MLVHYDNHKLFVSVHHAQNVMNAVREGSWACSLEDGLTMMPFHVHGNERSSNHLNPVLTFLVFVILTDLLFVVGVTLLSFIKITTWLVVIHQIKFNTYRMQGCA